MVGQKQYVLGRHPCREAFEASPDLLPGAPAVRFRFKGEWVGLLVWLLGQAVAQSASAGDIWDQPAKVVDRKGYLEITGTVPPLPAGKGTCSLKDINNPKGGYVPAVCAHINTMVPPGTVFVRADLFARRSGETEWLTCVETELEDAEYRQCMAEGRHGRVVQYGPGMTGTQYCFKTTRTVCGNYTETNFARGNANYACENIGDEFRKLSFVFNHLSGTNSYDFLIKAHYRGCNVETENEFESN